MAIFEVVEGKPGQGKSLYTARKVRELLYRNKRWLKDPKNPNQVVRPIYSNMKFSPQFERQNKGFIKYWTNIDEITHLHDADLIWDEIATELDSRNFANLSEELKRFLSQYRKRGVDIYSNTQDFSMIDQRARLMITNVKTLNKIIGSRDPSPTKPPIKRIWGIIMERQVEKLRADDPHNKQYIGLPSFWLIDKQDVEIYDTRQDIPQSPPLPRKKRHTEIQYFGGEKDGTSEYRYF